MHQILTAIGLKLILCNDGRKFRIERSKTAAVRTVLLRAIYEIKNRTTHELIIPMRWIHQNHSWESCWQRNGRMGAEES
jgi:hypothetical protein